MKRGRKAQVTVFIIIGILILLTAAILVYFYKTKAAAPVKRLVIVPEEARQVYDYVTSCLQQVGKDGLLLLGTQGGYIEIPPRIGKNKNAYLPVDREGIAKIPYWYYEREDRTPTLKFIQKELSRYITLGVKECVNLEAFSDRQAVKPLGEIVPIITMSDDKVITELKWPLEINTNGRITRIEDFVISHTVKLKEMWELAARTMEKENKDGWFENLTIDFLSMNSRIPMDGMEFSCGVKKWHLQEIKKEIQQTMYYNLPYVRVKGTNYPPPFEPEGVYESLRKKAQDIRSDLESDREPNWPLKTPEDAFEINRMMIDLGAVNTRLKAGFVYQPDWQLFVNAQPNTGGVMSTAQIKGARKYLPFFCINQWHFTYDLIYPVKMTIRDDEAFNGEGYIFQMAFPVIIEDNEESRTFFGLRRFIAPDYTSEFCNNKGTRLVDIRVMGFVEGSPVAEELEEANITYKCMNQECNLGKTYSDGTGAIRLTAYLPEGCGNPSLMAEKQGYITGEEYARQDIVDVMLTKLRRMNYTILVHPYYEELDLQLNPKNQKWLEQDTYSKFSKTMHATITMNAHNANLEQFKTYPADATQFTQGAPFKPLDISGVETEQIDFIENDAQYDLDIILFTGDTPIGGYHAENLTIKYDELAGKNNVIFHAVEYRPLPEAGEQQAGMFLFLYERGEYSGMPYWQKLKPEFR